MNKTKILLICHFSNDEIQELLPLYKKRKEMAPWIPNLLKGFENNEEYEIHVISPHDYLKQTISFNIKNINYYFVPAGLFFIGNNRPGFWHLYAITGFYKFRRTTKKLVKRIKPDLINLIGPENAYYSSAIFDFKDNYKILITIQGFVSQMKGLISPLRMPPQVINNEEKILKNFKYFAGEQDSSTYISSYNPNHNFFKMYFPVNEDLITSTLEQDKKYDCIYYARVTKLKGIEDFIKVIYELKKTKKDITSCVIGAGNTKPYVALAEELDCLQNIVFLGFINTQKELFQIIKSSTILLVPTLFDRLPTTIREAMSLKVPIVSYATGGIPYINEFEENLLLVETGDYKEMAKNALTLLTDENKRIKLAEKAYKYALSEFSLKVNTKRLIDAYKEVILTNF